MRPLLLGLLALSAALTEEPEPVSDEERHDEAAQSNQRTVWIACMTLARALAVEHELELSPILNRSTHDKEATRKKIIADIIYKCATDISLAKAHDLLADDNLDILSDVYEPYLAIDEAQFLDPERDISLTPEQVALYAAIRDEATNTKDGFDKETPAVEDHQEPPPPVEAPAEVDYQLLGIVGSCNVGLLGILIYCWKCRGSSTQSAASDKKRDRKRKNK